MPGLSNQTTKIIICKETTNSGRNNYEPAEPQTHIYDKCPSFSREALGGAEGARTLDPGRDRPVF